jgi:hypothetical protein
MIEKSTPNIIISRILVFSFEKDDLDDLQFSVKKCNEKITDELTSH